MDIPHFIQHPPTETELQTAYLLAKGKNVKQIAAIRYLAPATIEGHTKSLRFKFHCPTIWGTICLMILLRYIKIERLKDDLPPDWMRYLPFVFSFFTDQPLEIP